MSYPKGKPIRITTFADTDHKKDTKTKWYATGALMFLNKTPIHWYIRRKNNVETSSYVSDLEAMIIATEFTMSVRYKIRMIRVPIDELDQNDGRQRECGDQLLHYL